METSAPPPNILHLEGVMLKDYVPIEDVADSNLLDPGATAAAGSSDEPLDKIPAVFTGLEDWPSSTNLRCWECGFSFSSPPRFVPTFVREAAGSGLEVGVQGNMCSFGCAELWIETSTAPGDRWRAQDSLCVLFFLFTGRRTVRIVPSPRRTRLCEYGGTLSTEAFRRLVLETDNAAACQAPVAPVAPAERICAVLARMHPRPPARATGLWALTAEPAVGSKMAVADTEAGPEAEPEGPDGEADGEAEAETDGELEAEIDGELEAVAEVEPDGEPDGEPEAELEAEADELEAEAGELVVRKETIAASPGGGDTIADLLAELGLL